MLPEISPLQEMRIAVGWIKVRSTESTLLGVSEKNGGFASLNPPYRVQPKIDVGRAPPADFKFGMDVTQRVSSPATV